MERRSLLTRFIDRVKGPSANDPRVQIESAVSTLQEQFSGKELIQQVVHLADQEEFANPLAQNEIGVHLNRLGEYRGALPLFSSSAMGFLHEGNKGSSEVAIKNLTVNAQHVNQEALELRKKGGWKPAKKLFRSVIQNTNQVLDLLENLELRHEHDAAREWLKTPPKGFRP